MNRSVHLSEDIADRIISAQNIWLFLDYDGTLADFTPAPDIIIPDLELISLLEKLSNRPKIRLSVISGRRLDLIKRLLPINNIDLAGTYGIEIRLACGKLINRVDLKIIRPSLEKIMTEWSDLTRTMDGFHLEDKGYALAIHAKHAAPIISKTILSQAHAKAASMGSEIYFNISGGDEFLEIAPTLANKAIAVEYLLNLYPDQERLVIYMGDDDKDEDAFSKVQSIGGYAILVSEQPRKSNASLRINSPKVARQWLTDMIHFLNY